MTDTVVLEMPSRGYRFDTWTSYSFDSNFLSPTDEWHVNLESEELPKKMLDSLIAGERVTLSVNGHIQGDGYIDETMVHNDRDSGTQIIVEGRDRLAQMVDTNMDPRVKIPDTSTLEQFVCTVAGPFGWSDPSQVTDTNKANQNVLTGQNRGIRTTVKGRYLKSALKHRLKPYPHEGSFAFLSRVTQRHGLWVWLSADGTQLVVGKPSFDQEAVNHLTRLVGDGDNAQNNIIRGGPRISLKAQPSIIIAQGRGGGGEFPKSRITVLIQNPAVVADNSKIRAAYPDAIEVFVLDDAGNPLANTDFRLITSSVARPMFLEDDEAKTPDELANFARREMALKMRQGFTYSATVNEHTQNGVPWAVDTVVRVDDDRTNIHENLYVLGRTFVKSRTDGTKTHLELIRPHTMVF